ncbi:MAG: GTPase, partial [Kiritimatiellia bacterium]|nr:GTPase [Kiritimatiellia bacterium]
MNTTPRSLRLQIGLFGRTNVGKSSLLNYLAGQDVAITSPIPGTTTDVVEKPMELLPIGPVVFLDTAGLDDQSALGEQRLRRTTAIFERADRIVLILEPGVWSDFEASVLDEAARRKTPCLAVINKIDTGEPSRSVLDALKQAGVEPLRCSCIRAVDREPFVELFKRKLVESGSGAAPAPASIL